MDDAVRERIKDSIVCGRYPDLQDIVDFWNFVEKDDVKLASFKTEDSFKLESLAEINEKIEICKNVKEHIVQTKSFLSKIRFFLPSPIAFSLIRASDKLNLAWIHAESWEKKLIAAKHDLN